MSSLKKKFAEKAVPVAAEVRTLLKEHGEAEIGKVTVESMISGMKGLPVLLTLTSKLDPQEGIRFRGYSIPELQEKLPKLGPDDEPLPEGLFYLMMVDELPTMADVKELGEEWKKRAVLPAHVKRVLDSTPPDSAPMADFAIGIVALSTESEFVKAYNAGAGKKDYWDSTYEDVMNFLAQLPLIAAYIYRKHYHKGNHIPADPKLDWSANLAHMMGYDNPEIYKLFRLYLTIHADHEGGNVSAHATHLVGSALSNPFYSYAAGMLGLAGPLHGYANQEVVAWILDIIKELGTDNPTKQQIHDFCEATIGAGRVIPGYGHAVLRKTDPRYMAQKEFAAKYCKGDSFIQIVNDLYEVVPPILGGLGKVKNPWPNVDAYSGSLLRHYKIMEAPFYTVLFGVSRALGVMASLLWDRALGLNIERPSSFTLEGYQKKVGIK
ncbi:MAG: citrate (Si)-synthase [Bacteroidetes bacterium]|nr:MAG: citrate (Si)-synthase [Bacteroidota bacterium]